MFRSFRICFLSLFSNVLFRSYVSTKSKILPGLSIEIFRVVGCWQLNGCCLFVCSSATTTVPRWRETRWQTTCRLPEERRPSSRRGPRDQTEKISRSLHAWILLMLIFISLPIKEKLWSWIEEKKTQWKSFYSCFLWVGNDGYSM